MKNVKNLLLEYSGIFVSQADFVYKFRKNRVTLNVWFEDNERKLNSVTEYKVIENYAKELLRSHCFVMITFINVFDENESHSSKTGWVTRLAKNLKRYKSHIVVKGSNIVIYK